MTNRKEIRIRRGDIYYADLSPVRGSEQGGVRPVVVIQNDCGNFYSPTIIAAATTSRLCKTELSTHISIRKNKANGFTMDTVVLTEQIRTIDRSRLSNYIGRLNDNELQQINAALALSVGLLPFLCKKDELI